MNKKIKYYVERCGTLYKADIYNDIGWYFYYYNNIDNIWSRSCLGASDIDVRIIEISDEDAFVIMLEMEKALTSNYAKELVKQLFK